MTERRLDLADPATKKAAEVKAYAGETVGLYHCKTALAKFRRESGLLVGDVVAPLTLVLASGFAVIGQDDSCGGDHVWVVDHGVAVPCWCRARLGGGRSDSSSGRAIATAVLR